MQLTNGIDNQAVMNSLQNRILWRANGGSPTSGRYFEDFHTLCDTDLITQLQNDTTISLSTYLSQLSTSVILEAVNAIFNKPQVVDEPKLAFYRTDRLYLRPVLNTSAFCGIKIDVGKGNYAIKINSAELFFDKACIFNLYLYNDMTLAPLWTQEVTAAPFEQTIIDLSEEVILNYLSAANKGGIFYFGYYQDDIESQGASAQYYNVEYSTFKPCRCMSFQSDLKPSPVDGSRNFDRYILTANYLVYGLNIEVSTYRDFTNTIVQNAHLFDELIGLMMAAKVLEMMAFTIRSNRIERLVTDNEQLFKVYTDLNQGKPSEELPYTMGLRQKISREVFRVNQAFNPKKATSVSSR